MLDYRGRTAKGKLTADAFADGQALKAHIKKRMTEQKELLGLVAFDTDRVATLGRFATSDGPPAGPSGARTTAAATPAPAQTASPASSLTPTPTPASSPTATPPHSSAILPHGSATPPHAAATSPSPSDR